MVYLETVIGITGIGIGVFTTYTLMRFKVMSGQIKMLKEFYEDYPSPEEVAKLALSTRVPVSELPDNVKADLLATAKKMYEQNNNVPKAEGMPPIDSPAYVG